MKWSLHLALPGLSPTLVVLLGVLLPRLLVLGDFPHMDEGYYIYYAQLIFQSLIGCGHLPDFGSLNLYSLLLAPLCALPGNLFIWMRLADLVFATIFGLVLCKFLIRECGDVQNGLAIGLVCLLCLNAPSVVDAGVKNSFFLAWAALFYALLLAEEGGRYSLFFAGVLTALAVLLREPFAIYSIIGAVAVLLEAGFVAACLYSLGGLLTGFGILGLMALWRGGYHGLINAYLQAGTVIGAESDKIMGYFLHASWRFFCEFWPLLLFAFVAFSLLFSYAGTPLRRRAFFWLCLILAPFTEILGKISFLYHFSQLLPPIAGALALSFRCRQETICSRLFLKSSMFIFAALLIFVCDYHPASLARTVKVMSSFPQCQWPEQDGQKSNTLAAGEVVRKLPGHTLSVSGFMYFLYPLTRRLPQDPRMDDLSRTYLRLGQDSEKLGAMIREFSPEVIVIGVSQEKDHVTMFTEEIQSAIEKSRLYELVDEIPTDEEKNYGWIGSRIYRRIF